MKSIIYDGSALAEDERIALRAGGLNLLFEAGTLRYIRSGNVELIRQIYAAVRDQNWGTVPGELVIKDMQVEADSFRIVFEMTHADLFRWTGTITGDKNSTVTFDFDGIALRDFWRNRVGFCVLHPMEAAGKPCKIEHADGTITEAEFPESIQPHQPFFNIRSITHEASPHVRARVVMEGDIFEMEDQRNWTDASFKTYCTPLAQAYPAEVKAGDRVQQTITVSLVDDIISSDADEGDNTPVITLLQETVSIPAIGLSMASHDEPLTSRQIAHLRQLNLAHLRVDVQFDQSQAKEHFLNAAQTSVQIDVPLEIAIFASDDAESELKTLAGLLDELHPLIARFAVFHQSQKTTPASLSEVAQKILARFNAPIGGGTDAFFTELNRERPPLASLDFVTYSLNPQVHAFDNASLVETLAAQAATVQSVQAFSDGKSVHISPVTFKMRWNPNATAPDPEPAPDQLPAQVDGRQSSLFGAAWTMGSIKQLAESGTAAITYYETTDWLGVMAGENGSRLPDQFHDIPASVYPVWHVFKQVGDFAGAGEIVRTISSQPLMVESLALRSDDGLCILVSNFTAQTQSVRLRNVPSGNAQLHVLDEHHASLALSDPDAFLHSAGQIIDRSGDALVNDLVIELPPYAVAALSWQGMENS